MTRSVRELALEDRILWSKVAKSATPLPGKAPVEDAARMAAEADKTLDRELKPADGTNQTPIAPVARRPAHALHPIDRTTRRKIAKGTDRHRGAHRSSRADTGRSVRLPSGFPSPRPCGKHPLCPRHHRQGELARQHGNIAKGGARVAGDTNLRRIRQRIRGCRARPWRRRRALYPPEAAAAEKGRGR